MLCDNALIAAYASGKKVVDKSIVKTVIGDMDAETVKSKSRLTIPLAALGLIILTALWLSPLPSVIADHMAPSLSSLQNDSPPEKPSQPEKTNEKESQAEAVSPQQGSSASRPAFWLEDIPFPRLLFEQKNPLSPSASRQTTPENHELSKKAAAGQESSNDK
jgi:cytoskeletal protein RodZ